MTRDLEGDLQELTQFLYQFPIGVIDMNADGDVSMMNPAAIRLLATETEPDETLPNPLPILRRLAPRLFDLLEAEPDRTGMVTDGRGHDIDSRDGVTRFTITVNRVNTDRLMFSLTDVTEERRLLNEQRARAQRLQRALLGRIDVADLDLSVTYVPANRDDLSGGDWYDVINVDGNRVALVVGDVVGHDIEASAVMGQLRAIVRSFALVDPDPQSVLERTDKLARSIEGATAATIHYALVDKTEMTVSYASAGHPPALVLRTDGSSEFLFDGRQPVLGVANDETNKVATTHLGEGDVLVMFTDGLIERRGESLDDGMERLRAAAVALNAAPSIDSFVERLTKDVLEGTNQHDDVCVLALRR